MKTTILHSIVALRALSTYFIIALLLAFSSCQTDEVAPIQPGGKFPGPGGKTPVPTSIPPAEVVRTDYAGAIKWRITFESPKYAYKWFYQRFFSTVEGTFRTRAELNSSSMATSQADMDFLFGRVQATREFDHHLHFDAYAPNTQFKPADLGLMQLANITMNNPALFQDEFENSPMGATYFQPYNYSKGGDESTYYENGDIFLFKTDRNPARYGAVRIVERSNIYQGIGPRIVEVIVQADNNIVQLGK